MKANQWIIALLVCLFSYHASANLVTYNFTATIQAGDGIGALGISLGDQVTGSFSIDLSTPVFSINSVRATYFEAGTNITYDISGVLSGQSDSSSDNTHFLEVFTFSSVHGIGFLDDVNGTEVDGLFPSIAGIQFFDHSATVLDGLDIPSPLLLSDWGTAEFFLMYPVDFAPNILLTAQLNSLTQVPVPPAIWLSISALVFLFGLNRKRSMTA